MGLNILLFVGVSLAVAVPDNLLINLAGVCLIGLAVLTIEIGEKKW